MRKWFPMSNTILSDLQIFFTNAVQAAFGATPGVVLEVTRSTDPRFGHYQFNSAMKLVGALPEKQSPRKIAESIVQAAGSHPLIEKLEIAGPGFINITLNREFLEKRVEALLLDEKLLARTHKNERVVVDFSSPNVAKEMHVGHLRSTIIGDSIARLFEFLGYDVLRLNHIGDWGTSFGMLIAYMKEHQVVKADLTLLELMTFYKAAKVQFDADAAFKKRSQLEVVALQNGDKEALKIWNMICEISRVAYNKIYEMLDIKIIERGESYYNPQLADVVQDCEKKGLVEVSDGAKCIFLEGFVNREGERLPLMLQKSDGGYNYDTTDMAALRHRVQDEKAARICIVTDAGQATHFQQIFQAGKLAGYYNPEKVRLDHVPFGLVLGADGKKFRTRSGETEKLEDLLNAAVIKAEEIVRERHPEWTEAEQKEVARQLGIGAIKYADLASNRISDYSFSYEKMLKFEGNTVAFVMYAYVRTLGIQRKIGAYTTASEIKLTHASEVQLALHLLRFAETVDQMAEDLMPHRFVEYLYNLAEYFNVFFRDCRVEGAAEQASRLQLVEATRRVLERGLKILGIGVIDKM